MSVKHDKRPGPGGLDDAGIGGALAKPIAKRKAQADFWRATRFLRPYWKLILTSVLLALLVGGAMAGGLTTMLPILRVLINGDTVPNWVNRGIVGQRLGLTLASDGTDLRVVKVVDRGGAGARAGLRPGDNLTPDDGADQTTVLGQLSDPAVVSMPLRVIGSHLDAEHTLTLSGLPAIPFYEAPARQWLRRFPTGPVRSVAAVLAVCVVISLFGNTLRIFQEYCSDKASILAISDLRRRLYDHALHLPMGYFSLKGTSDPASRVLQDCAVLQEGYNGILGQTIQMIFNAVWAFGVAVAISWQLTGLMVLFAVPMGVVIKTYGKKMRRASRRNLQNGAVLLGQIEASFSGIRVVKASLAERQERRRFWSIMRLMIAQALRLSWLDAVSSPVVEVLTLLAVCVVVLLATAMVQVWHDLSVEKFFVVMACLATMADAVRRLGKLNNNIQKSGAAATRIFELLEIPVERPRFAAARVGRPTLHLPALSREIRFEEVTFSYGGSASPALAGVNLKIAAGESVAIVGRNGSGKTTLAALLPRFYDPQLGRVTLDGVDIRTATLTSLRQQISVVTQDSVVFPGTIAENIAYGHPHIASLKNNAPAGAGLRQKIEDAARRAFAHDFIMDKPLGYDTMVGELGGSLSGGQRQRLNIARAILRATPILILDEATSQVDAESEELIQKAIDSLMHERTTIVIAHRLGTILGADRIIVMDRGQIVGHGSHDQLLSTCDTYANLYERQLIAPAAGTATVG
jgi:subfamily B ATP-binding cassette protein MsbA